AAARFKKLARYEVESLDDDRYVADDRDGARGVYRVLVREPTRRVMMSWGQHSGRVLGTIGGSALTILDFAPHADGVEPTLTAYVRIDNRVAAAIARLVAPLFGYLADRKLAETIGVSAVAAPSTLGFVARITSVVSPTSSRTRSSLTLRSSGPMPSSGESAPSSTW